MTLRSRPRAGAVQPDAVEDGANTRPKRRGRPSKADAAAKGQLVGEIYDEADLQPGENVAPAVAADRGSDDDLLSAVRCQASVRRWEACCAQARELCNPWQLVQGCAGRHCMLGSWGLSAGLSSAQAAAGPSEGTAGTLTSGLGTDELAELLARAEAANKHGVVKAGLTCSKLLATTYVCFLIL